MADLLLIGIPETCEGCKSYIGGGGLRGHNGTCRLFLVTCIGTTPCPSCLAARAAAKALADLDTPEVNALADLAEARGVGRTLAVAYEAVLGLAGHAPQGVYADALATVAGWPKD